VFCLRRVVSQSLLGIYKKVPRHTRRTDKFFLLVLILHSKGAENKCAAITTQDSAFTNTKAGVEPGISACPEET
jgi:hypothetical protein